MSLKLRLGPTGRFLALEVAHQLDDVVHVVETLQLALVVDDLHGLLDHLLPKIPREKFRGGGSSDEHHLYRRLVAYIVQELHQGVGGQFAVVLDDLVIGKDVNTLHLIQTWRENSFFMILGVGKHT